MHVYCVHRWTVGVNTCRAECTCITPTAECCDPDKSIDLSFYMLRKANKSQLMSGARLRAQCLFMYIHLTY